jgi:hypothetical protein
MTGLPGTNLNAREIMKTILLLLKFTAGALLFVLLPGCIVEEKFTFNEVELTGPVAQTPINITVDPRPGSVQLVPRFSVNTEHVIKGSLVPSPGLATQPHPPVITFAAGQNAMWELPKTEYGLDIQIAASKHFGFLLGGMYASTGDHQFTNVRLGVALFGVRENLGYRLDAGAQFSSMNYRCRSTVTTDVDWIFGQSRYISNFDDRGSVQSPGPYFGLTLNSVYRESPVNGFIHVGLALQPLLNYHPAVADTLLGPGDNNPPTWSVKSTTTVLCFAGGVAVELGGGQRVLIGARGYQPFAIDSPTPAPIWQPFVQFAIGF